MIRSSYVWIVLAFFWAITSEIQAQSEDWTFMNRGDQFFKKGDFKSAERCYDHALKHDSINIRARFNLADAYLAQGIADSAYVHFKNVANESKDGGEDLLRSKAFHNMGVITQNTANATQEQDKKQNYLKQAIADYKEALRLNPYADDSRYNMVLCMKQLKESEQQQQNQQQDDKSKQQNKQEEQSKQKQQKQNQNTKPNPENSHEKENTNQTKQILNYARQKEQHTKDKLNVIPQRRQKGKNW